MRCIYCNNNCIKKGTTTSGVQKYWCKHCGKHQREQYKNNAFHPQTNRIIVACLKNGCGIRGIAAITQASSTTIIKRIKAIAAAINKPIIKLRKTYEADEVKTYVRKKKNEQWIMYAINRNTKEVVDFVVGRRNKNNLKLLVNTLLLGKAKAIYTDKLNLYCNLIPQGLHRSVVHTTNHIERKNLNLRTHLKRIARKTICFSKDLSMLNACLKIYFWG